MNARTTWRQWAPAGLAALYLLGLSFLAGMTVERNSLRRRADHDAHAPHAGYHAAKQRLMLLELDHAPEAGKRE